MRRADRLFRIVQLMRRRRTVITAGQIARRLEISERTVYRDISDLIAAGTPITGEAGVGYRLQPGYDLPPLMFDRDEIQALVLGARIVRQVGDPALSRAADSILGKVANVLPKDLEPLLAETRLFMPNIVKADGSAVALALAREALIARRRMHFSYTKPDGEESKRSVRPLGLFFWGRTWTVAA
jgi:predicted DNA-binding transcriptional regulator YafY